MQARATDVKDISRRVVNILTGQDETAALDDQPAILVADDLTPSETVQLDKTKLLGFITRHGSSNSHTAILARTMNIPALIGVDFDDTWDGKLAVLDGYNHCVYIEPAAELLSAMEAKRTEDLKQEALLQGLKKKPNITLDGREIKVYANIGNAGDVGLVLQNDAQGIGLFRSEFIYLDSQDYPTEDQQFMLYKRVVETMAGKKVIIRTLDIGADKQADYFQLDKEDNPALGYRAIRICLTRKEIFKTQLRAILRASAFGTVSIMFPMVISVREVRDAKEVLEECKAELKERGVAMGEVEIGIMVETPAAVMVADELAEEVDFFSLGTNDLTQYTLAIDRQNPKLDNFYDPHHPAVLRMIRHTVEAGHRHNCWVGICGELGADQTLTETFLRMGLDELSVSPSVVLPLRKLIRSMDLSQASE
jgi:phosphotransferase system enzyme I (PtsI)